jgi:hypothetical protein
MKESKSPSCRTGRDKDGATANPDDHLRGQTWHWVPTSLLRHRTGMSFQAGGPGFKRPIPCLAKEARHGAPQRRGIAVTISISRNLRLEGGLGLKRLSHVSQKKRDPTGSGPADSSLLPSVACRNDNGKMIRFLAILGCWWADSHCQNRRVIHLYRSNLSEPVPTKAAPLPLFRQIH